MELLLLIDTVSESISNVPKKTESQTNLLSMDSDLPLGSYLKVATAIDPPIISFLISFKAYVNCLGGCLLMNYMGIRNQYNQCCQPQMAKKRKLPNLKIETLPADSKLTPLPLI